MYTYNFPFQSFTLFPLYHVVLSLCGWVGGWWVVPGNYLRSLPHYCGECVDSGESADSGGVHQYELCNILATITQKGIFHILCRVATGLRIRCFLPNSGKIENCPEKLQKNVIYSENSSSFTPIFSDFVINPGLEY